MRHRIRATLLAVGLGLLGWVATLSSAYAGGPTSVLVVHPAAEQADALYYTEKNYQRLVEAVGAYETPTGPTDPPASVSTDAPERARLTWMIHDMQIFRVDRIYVTKDDGVWVQTMADVIRQDPFAQPGRWHRARDAKALLAVVSQPSATSPTSPVVPEPTATRAAATGPSEPAAGSSTGVGVGAGLAGMAVGAGGMLLLRRAGASRRPRAVLTG